MSRNVVPLPQATTRYPEWTWADRVRKVRRELGLTQSGFADLTGFGDKRIGAWESGRTTPDIANVSARLEKTTGVSRLWWLGWDKPSPDGSFRIDWIHRDLRHTSLASSHLRLLSELAERERILEPIPA